MGESAAANGATPGYVAASGAPTLAIRDRVDTEAGPCARYFPAAPGLDFSEIVLDVNRGHGLFYTPERVWIDPVVEFASK